LPDLSTFLSNYRLRSGELPAVENVENLSPAFVDNMPASQPLVHDVENLSTTIVENARFFDGFARSVENLSTFIVDKSGN
jgi:hypothetical protein